eukprot:6323333-Prymnesium_polylepis.2
MPTSRSRSSPITRRSMRRSSTSTLLHGWATIRRSNSARDRWSLILRGLPGLARDSQPDLLFAGENVQKRMDKIPRQWLTRLYYLAHSPFYITWALDSNVISCTHGSAATFLERALTTALWDFDIAHASQNVLTQTMYPHNFNIVYRWSQPTSDLMR